MGTLIMVGQFLLGLSFLIVLHEGGHYLAARLFKTRVEKFYLFFDFLFPFPNLAKFSLIKFKKGDTEYGIGWFPLGGYVKIAGMLDESADKEAMKQPPQPWEFRSKPAWQRLIIILGGIIVNLVLGILIFSMSLFIWGEEYLPTKNTKYGIWVVDSAATEMGLMTGDKILTIDNKEVEGFHQVLGRIIIDQSSSIQVDRDGEKKDIAVTDDFIAYAIANADKSPIIQPRLPFVIGNVRKNTPAKTVGLQANDQIVSLEGQPIHYFDEFREKIEDYKSKQITIEVLREGDTLMFQPQLDTTGLLGVELADMRTMEKLGLLQLARVKYGFFESFPAGFKKSVGTIKNYAKNLGLMFKPKTGAYKKMGGFATMSKLYGRTWDWQNFWYMTGLISLILAFMNFLPIPMLDGGYMMFILWEMVTGKPPGEKFMEVANTVGFIIVLALLIYANGNDIFRAITGN